MFAPEPFPRGRRIARVATIAGVSVAAFLLASPHVGAQSASSVAGASGGMTVAGELDDYLRYMESLGRTPLLPWGLRPFAPSLVDSLTHVRGAHPWGSQWLFERPERPAHARILPLEVTERYNSAYPYGINEGPVWAGRGLTSAVSAGFALAAGPLAATVRPIVFRAENQGFALRPNGTTGALRFNDPMWPVNIDRPQRFGTGPYTHFDLGETTVRLDLAGISLGATTANEWWGPASVFPYIVGNNAAGVPRVFIGTEKPVNIYVGTIQARVQYGMESQSAFSPVVGPDTFASGDSSGRKRLMSGFAMTFSPKIFPGLEIDAARYFHEAWTGHFGSAELRTPFEGLTKSKIPRGVVVPGADDRDALKNQLASVAFRWVLPHSGIDVYGEYGREDHAENTRALEVQLDLTRTAMVGFRKAFQRADSAAIDAVRAEIFDGNPTTIGIGRNEGTTYIHYPLRQGHTEEGKVIGSPAGVGAPAGATLAWDRYRATGRTSVYLAKTSEDTQTEMPSAPTSEGVVGASALRFTKFGEVLLDLAAVRASRVQTGWGGWNLSATVGIEMRVP